MASNIPEFAFGGRQSWNLWNIRLFTPYTHARASYGLNVVILHILHCSMRVLGTTDHFRENWISRRFCYV